MKTRIVPPDAVGEVVGALRAGAAVALPSETVYGLAADALDGVAVAKIFEAKERPFFDPLIVHVADLAGLGRIAELGGGLVGKLMEEFWPGPLTFILPRRAAVPDLVTAGLETVAVRCPAHPLFREVLQALGRPLAAPSANRFGRISPTTAAHVESELGGRIPLILDGGPSGHGLESTIVRVRDGVIEVLRPGPVTMEMLRRHAPVELTRNFAGQPLVPGALPSHYAPRTPLVLAENPTADAPAWGLLAWRTPPEGHGFARVEVLSPAGSMTEAAARLFGCLRRLDESGVDRIVAEPVPEEGLGVAIMDRLRRAAG